MEALTFSHLDFAYAGASRRVLSDVCWSVPAGAFVLLVGETGSGKTTLLRCAKPEMAPVGERSGEVLAFGKPLVAASGVSTAAYVGYVAQNPENQIVCDSVWHELAFGLENMGLDQAAMRRRVAEVAHFFGIEPWFHRDTASLSGGQKQMLNLAAVLAMQPRVLLLDEPTSQLDPVAQRNFLHALFRINRELGITVVVATHMPETMVDYATAAACVRDGAVHPCDVDDFRIPSDTPEGDFREGGEALPAAACASRLPSEPAVRLGEVFFRYSREAPWVLFGADLLLDAGRIHAIVGGNGCGKSTALRLMAGSIEPTRGRVRNNFAQSQALLPQDPKALLVCDTVREELEEWSKAAGYGAAEIDAMLERMDLTGVAAQHPFDTSGGQQQRIALAKLLLTEPQLLLLDEPTKGLDAASKLNVARILTSLRDEGRTVVMVTHDVAFASRVADTMTMLFDGEVAASEPAREFCRNNLFYRPSPDGFTQLWDGLSRDSWRRDGRECAAGRQGASSQGAQL